MNFHWLNDLGFFPLAALRKGAVSAAPRLIGALLVRRSGKDLRVGRIVETEAYHQDDLASHSHGGPQGRNVMMYEEAGHCYVYRSYGIHFCMNIVCGEKNRGEAVLIRAVEPVEGLDQMYEARGGRHHPERNLCSGPGKVCQAMGIGMEFNGAWLLEKGKLMLLERESEFEGEIKVATRIGITKAAEEPWRFFLAGNQHVSRGKSRVLGSYPLAGRSG